MGMEAVFSDSDLPDIGVPSFRWLFACQRPRIARIADGRTADWIVRVGDVATSDPRIHIFIGRFGFCAGN
eukprot:3048918-Alexandrium_andersonii.AAC.1